VTTQPVHFYQLAARGGQPPLERRRTHRPVEPNRANSIDSDTEPAGLW